MHRDRRLTILFVCNSQSPPHPSVQCLCAHSSLHALLCPLIVPEASAIREGGRERRSVFGLRAQALECHTCHLCGTLVTLVCLLSLSFLIYKILRVIFQFHRFQVITMEEPITCEVLSIMAGSESVLNKC